MALLSFWDTDTLNLHQRTSDNEGWMLRLAQIAALEHRTKTTAVSQPSGRRVWKRHFHTTLSNTAICLLKKWCKISGNHTRSVKWMDITVNSSRGFPFFSNLVHWFAEMNSQSELFILLADSDAQSGPWQVLVGGLSYLWTETHKLFPPCAIFAPHWDKLS